MTLSFVEIYKHNVAETNWISNPGAESNITGWQAVNGTLARTTSQFRSGVASFQVTKGASGSTLSIEQTVAGTSANPVTANTPHAISGGFRPGSGVAVGSTIRCEVQWYNGATPTTVTSTATRTTSTQTWYGVQDALVAPAGSTHGKARYTFAGPGGAAIPTGAVVYFDDLTFGPLTTPVLLSKYSNCAFDVQYNNASAISFSYPVDEADALGIGDGTEVGIRVGFTDATPVDVERYTISGTGKDKVVDGVKLRTFNGSSLYDRLKDAVVYPSNWPVAAPAGHSFVGATIGTILRTLMARAHARGTLSDIAVEGFSGTVDSNGAAWTALDANGNSVSAVFDMDYSSGQGYDAVLQDFVDRGYVDAWIDTDHRLNLVVGGTRGSHISIGSLEVRPGYNVAEMSVDTSAQDTASAVLMEGEEGTAVEVANDALRSLLNRRRERYVSQGGVSDAGVLQLLGAGELQSFGKIVTEETVGFGSNLTPFKDFQIADWIWVRTDTDKAPMERRVRQIAVGVDENRNITIAGTLNDFLYEADVRNRRRLDAIAGGSGSSYGGGSTPTDNTIPSPPTGVSITSGYTTTPSGDYTAALVVNWTAPTTNVGGSPISDLSYYEIQWRYNGSTTWSSAMRTSGTETTFGYSPVTPGLDVDVRVRAVDTAGHRSDWTATATATIAKDTTAPNPPSEIEAEGVAGGVRLYWDGKDNAGNAMPSDFSDIEIWEATAPGITPGSVADSHLIARMPGSGYVTAPGRGEGVTCYYVARAYDRAGNVSGVGPESSAAALPSEGGTDGNAPSTAPTLSYEGGIGSIRFTWTAVANPDPVTYRLYVRAGTPPTTADATYRVASGMTLQSYVRNAMSPVFDAEGTQIGESLLPITAGMDYYAIIVATDDDGPGPNSSVVIAQSTPITGPDIAVDAITADHIAANAITAAEISAGAVRAEALEAKMVLSNQIDIGQVDIVGLDPEEQNPNLLPTLMTTNASAGAITEDIWWPQVNGGSSWSQAAAEFNLESDDPLFLRLHSAVFPGYRVTNTGAAISGSTTSYLVMDTMVTVEPETEYRLTFGSAFPGSTAPSSAVVPDDQVNAVKIFVSSTSTFPAGGVAYWKSNSPDYTADPKLVQWEDGIIKTAVGQTSLYVRLRVDMHYIASQGSAWFIDPTLRKVVTDKTLEPPLSSTVPTIATTVPTATSTGWVGTVAWASGTPTTSIGLYTPGAGGFNPPTFGTPGRYKRPDQGTFMGTRGVRVTSRSSAAATATFSLRTPTVPLPAPGAAGRNISTYLEIGFLHLSIATNYLVEMYLFDEADAQIGSPVTIGNGSGAFWGIGSLSEVHFTFRLDSGDAGTIPAEAVKAGFRVVATTSAGTAATDYNFGIHGVHLFSLTDVNPNYGQVEQQHIAMDRDGIRLTNELGQIQVNIPTDSNSTPTFKGEVEAGGLRVLGGATFESAENEIAKDSILSLSDGIKSPTGVPSLIQEYEQYTMGRQPPDGQFPGFSTKPTLNPAQITGMCWKSEWNEFWVMENRGGGSALWRFGTNGVALWAGLQQGWAWAVPFEDTRTTPGVNDTLYAGEYAGVHWAVVYTGSTRVFNKLPAGTIPSGVKAQFTWNQSLNRLYVWYRNTASGYSGTNVYKALTVNSTANGTMTLVGTVVSGAGTAPTASNLAGAVPLSDAVYTCARGTTAAETYAFQAGGALIPGKRFAQAGPPVGFCHDGSNFWSVDTSGRLTRYSNWTWNETNHKLYAGMTWYDADAGGTGIHETDLTSMTSVTLKKRISGIRVTLPQVPDKGGTDDPNQWRLYAAKAASLTLPTNRTSFWLQASGGSPSSQTSYVIPGEGLIASGTNPPVANNFPGAGAGRLISAKLNSSNVPQIDLRGDGSFLLGNIEGSTAGATQLIRFIARSTNTSQVSVAVNSTVNVGTITIPNPVAGRTYRVRAQAVMQSPVISGNPYGRLDIRHAFNANTGGTVAASAYIDHRVVNRSQGGFEFSADFVYPGATGSANYNVVLTAFAGGTENLVRGDLSPITLTLEEII